jgi:hypothetical protein
MACICYTDRSGFVTSFATVYIFGLHTLLLHLRLETVFIFELFQECSIQAHKELLTVHRHRMPLDSNHNHILLSIVTFFC